jgi:hypothetical protein
LPPAEERPYRRTIVEVCRSVAPRHRNEPPSAAGSLKTSIAYRALEARIAFVAAAVDAVGAIGGFSSLAGALSAEGNILSATNVVHPLRGIGRHHRIGAAIAEQLIRAATSAGTDRTSSYRCHVASV